MSTTAHTRPGRSVRVRVLAAMMALMLVGLVVAGAVTHTIMFTRLDERVDAELQQEVDELRLLSDRAGAQNVTELLQHAVDAAVPSEHESVLALTDGTPRFRPRSQDFALSTPEVIDAIRAAQVPGQTVHVDIDSPTKGQLRVAIASVRVDGDPTEGLFVVANAIGRQREELWSGVRNYVIVSVLTLVVVGVAGWLVTGRLLRPLDDLREATDAIDIHDLDRRVPVPASHDDIAALAGNFNRMLDRLQDGYDHQRQFLRDVGHELRTPVTIVHGTLEMMDPDDREDFDESREIALDELDRMGRLVGDLSMLAQSGQPDFIRVAPVAMAEFADDALARVRRVDEGRAWRLETAAPATWNVDGQRLMQAVVQLAANAVRYSDPGTPVTLGVEHRTSAGRDDLVLSVRDEGIGIAPEDQQRIFDRFVRLSSDRAGSGLGLSIVKTIAEGHGGHVEVTSTPGRGSRFALVLPRHPQTRRPEGGGCTS